MKLTVNLGVKTTITYKLLMFMIRCCAMFRLMDTETAAKIVCWTANKGWLGKYKIDNGKWRKLDFNFEYETAENESQ